MKIKIWKVKKYTVLLKINNRNATSKAVIPIGCDCHPAHMLDKMMLRQESLCFDWLDVQPLLAMQYAFENIRDSFSFFIEDLKINSNGKVYANKYPEALFYHFDDLRTNKKLQKKILERTKRLLSKIKLKPCYFIHNTKSEVFKTEQDVRDYLKTVINFTTLLKPKDVLLIYLRYDESLNENKQNCELLLRLISPLKQCKIVAYVRQKKAFGEWGDETQYKGLIKSLGMNLIWKFPKFQFVKRKNI